MANRVRTYFDISVDDIFTGRVVFELYNDIVPKTAENFRSLCVGAPQGTYKGCPFHRIIPDFMAQGGDFTNQDGTGGRSIYGEKFEDENFTMKHTRPGLLSMANAGPNTNGSQFFITFTQTPHLDGKHVVFGEVKKGMGLVRHLEKFGSSGGTPSAKIVIQDCGELAEGEDDGIASSDDGYPDWPEDMDKVEELNTDKIIEIATAIKTNGNTHFKEGENSKAWEKYSKAIRYIDCTPSDSPTSEQSLMVKNTKASCLLNRAQAKIKIGGELSSVKADTTAVLELGGIDVKSQEKAYYRRSLAQVDEDDKESDLKAVLKLNPKNASARRDLDKLREKAKAATDAMKKAMGKMFGS